VRWIAVVALVACSKTQVTAVADDATPGPPKTPSGFEYARSTTAKPIDTRDAFVVFLGRDGIRLNPTSDPLIPLGDGNKGFGAEHKTNGENDLRLPKLQSAVKGAKRSLMHVDRRVGYRPLIEVLFTLGQAEVAAWTFVLANDVGRAARRGAPRHRARRHALKIERGRRLLDRLGLGVVVRHRQCGTTHGTPRDGGGAPDGRFDRETMREWAWHARC